MLSDSYGVEEHVAMNTYLRHDNNNGVRHDVHVYS